MLGNGNSTVAQVPISPQKPCYDFNLKEECFKTNCLLKMSCMKCRGMHPSAMCNKFKLTNSIKTTCTYKTSPFNKYSPYVRTPLLNNPGRGLKRYDI